MHELQRKLNVALNSKRFSKDRIVLLQVKYLIDNLGRFAEQIA